MTDRLSQLRNLLDKDPHDAFCMYGIGMEYSKTGNHAQAIAWFDRTMEVDPTYCYAWYHKARVQEQSGDNAGAIQTLEDGITQAIDVGDQHAQEEMKMLLQSLHE
jgi:tetratricopeptide (TPR) repeat protein